MANYHRHEAAGTQVTSTGASVTFRSLRDDLVKLRATAPAGIVDKAEISLPDKTEQGKDIYVIRIGKNPAMPILIAGCHHAREWISVEVPYLLAEYLVQNYASDPRVRRIVDATDIWIVPLINPDGHEHSILVDRVWRKTWPTDPARESVDPNRNYVTSTWGGPTGQFSTTPTNEIYRGPSAGYAKEVIAMQNLITRVRFKATLDYHSFGRYVLFPWAGKVGPHPDPAEREVGNDIKRVVDSKGTTYALMPASALYPTAFHVPVAQGIVPGGMMDYVVENLPGAIAVTVELEPAASDRRGFVLPESEIDTTFALHRGSILSFLNCLSTLRTPPPVRPMTLRANARTDVLVLQQECWKAFQTY